MDKINSFKSNLCLVLCCALSISIITSVVFSLDGYETPLMNTDLALDKANTSLEEYCAKNGISPCDMKLVDVSPAEEADDWTFQYYSPKTGEVSVQVQKDGQMEMDSVPVAQVLPPKL